MAEYLIGVQYHEPEQYAQWERGVMEDYESSTGLFVDAVSAEAAIAWGEQVGLALLRHVNGDVALTGQPSASAWLVDSPQSSGWQHCLDHFQHVRDGQMPDLEGMTTEVYRRWLERRGGLASGREDG